MNGKLKKLITDGEGIQSDFKKTINNPAKIAKTLVAFANTIGGVLLIGVKDSGEIAGVKSEEEERYMLTKAATAYCRPVIDIHFEEIIYQHQTVILASVQESTTKPHYAMDDTGNWWVYVRNNDITALASPVVISTLRLQSTKTDNYVQLNPEQMLLIKFLEQHERITLNQFLTASHLPKRKAERILVKLLLAGILKVQYWQNQEYYTLN